MEFLNNKANLEPPRPSEKRKNPPRSERDEHIDAFTVKYNATTSFGKKAKRRIAVQLAGVPTWRLHPFFVECEKAHNFAAYFNWATDKTNAKKP